VTLENFLFRVSKVMKGLSVLFQFTRHGVVWKYS